MPSVTQRTLLLLFFLTGCGTDLPSRGAPIRIAGPGGVVSEVPLERYLAGVLAKEVHADWPLEALKAQAVASRTYALYRKEHPRDPLFDVYSDVSDQVFAGEAKPSRRIVQAVLETEGEILNHEGTLFPAFFHSCCGGGGEAGGSGWGGGNGSPPPSLRAGP